MKISQETPKTEIKVTRNDFYPIIKKISHERSKKFQIIVICSNFHWHIQNLNFIFEELKT